MLTGANHKKHFKKVQSKQICGRKNWPYAVSVRVRLSNMLELNFE